MRMFLVELWRGSFVKEFAEEKSTNDRTHEARFLESDVRKKIKI